MANIVIIDDESDVREILAETLAFYGHQVLQATGGEEGLEVVRRAHPDLVFLDLRMPGMNGYQVLEALRKDEATRGVPVILLTALNDSHSMVEGFRKGANDYMTKPFNADELLARVDVQLRIKRLEREVRESEARYRALFERSADPMVLLDEAGLIAQANDAAVALVGAGPERLLGACILDLISLSGRPEFESAVFGAFEGSQIPIFESRLVLLEGRPLPVDVDLHPIDVGGRRHLLLHLRDMRWRRATHAWSEMILRYIGDAIFITEGRGIILLASHSAADLTGYPREEIIGLDISRLHPPEVAHQWQEEILPDLREGEPRAYEGLLRQKDGRTICVEWAIALFFVDGENYLIGVARDLTDRKQLEEQLRQAQKMQAVGQLAGGIAHDFNNLLQVVTGYCELLLANLSPDDLFRRQVGEIKKAGDRAASLTRQLLAFSRRQVLQPEVLDLNEVVLNMEQALRRLLGERIDLVTILRPGLEYVKADPVQLEQVVLNLTVNARDAMPGGGRLTIETEDVALDEAYASEHPSVQPGPYVMLSVVDTGIGMDAEALSHLFEPFFTTKEQGRGTGLGLATVYGIVTQSGGHIAVDSEPGRGSTFRLYLPRFVEEVQVAPPGGAIAGLPGGSETILLVEDEDAVRDLVCRMLQLFGYNVVEASHGEDALRVSERFEGPIHLMVTDVMMPQMTGGELAERMKPVRSDMRVLYVSGYTDDEIVRQGVLEADMAFLQKPFAPDALARKVREVLDEKR